MAFSHDGMRWRYPRGRPAFIEPGEPGAPDAGFLTTPSNIIELGDEMWLYCSGNRMDHGWGITPDFKLDPNIPFEAQNDLVRVFVARIKRDRFASLAATHRCRFDVEVGPRQGRNLTVNARTGRQGVIRVAIAEQRSPFHLEPRKTDHLPGFGFDDCLPFSGDEVSAPARFRSTQVSGLPPDKFLILRFEVEGGEVFGYEWTD
jgi:hypothetical protein